MLARLVIFSINGWRWCANRWRRLLGRRVDYVRITLSGAVAEFADTPPRWQRMLTGARPPLSVAGMRRLFAQVGADPQARGVLLRIDGLESGWATLQSMRAAIADLRGQGKQVVAYLITPDVPSSYVAAAADRVLMHPTVHWNVLGLRAEVQFLQDALAAWGLTVEAVAVSPYKSAPDTFTRNDFTPESRAQFERLLALRYAELVRALSAGRNRTIATIEHLIDHAPLAPQAALQHGLVDALCYEDELEQLLKEEGGRDPVVLDIAQAQRALQIPTLRFHEQRVGLIRVEGTITRGASRSVPLPIPLIGGTAAGAESFAQAARQAERDDRIAAVVVYVNSPGGDVLASDLMWRELLRLRRRKPVVVAMGNAAASGGYYLATHASAIVAQPATVTGSIGVFVLRPVLAGLLERTGVHTTVVSHGANSGLMGGTGPLSEGERSALRELVLGLYDDFTQRVREGRGMTAEQLDPIAGGRVWLGEEAIGYGLVDALGGISEAHRRARELAGLTPDSQAPLAPIVGRRGDLPPQPFPTSGPEALITAVAELLRTRTWALLPFELRD